MKPWTIDAAGGLCAADGRPVAVLEPELPVDLVVALAAAPRVALLVERLAQAEATQREANEASPAKRKVLSDLAANAHAEAWLELRRLRADVEEARRAPHVSAGKRACECPGSCGEPHLGSTCGLINGQVIRRHADDPGIWTVLADRAALRPAVVATVTVVGDRPLCQRCAWLRARRGRAA